MRNETGTIEMGTPDPHPCPVLLFFGLLARNEEGLDEIRATLASEFGEIVSCSEVIPFTHSRYYESEMGSGLVRQWVLTDRLIEQDAIVEIKLRTNAIEDAAKSAIGVEAAEPGRSVNIDPGYLSLSKVVLATAKDHSHRLYLGRGIYAEVTLAYRAGEGFHPCQWTYPDHREPVAADDLLGRDLRRDCPERLDHEDGVPAHSRLGPQVRPPGRGVPPGRDAPDHARRPVLRSHLARLRSGHRGRARREFLCCSGHSRKTVLGR